MERRLPTRARRYRSRPRRTYRGGRQDGVLIGFDEMYDLLVDVHDKVSDLTKDHDQTRERISRLEEAHAQQNLQIQQLQRWRWTWAGAAAVAGGLLSRIIDIGITP